MELMDKQYKYEESQKRIRALWQVNGVYICDDTTKPLYSIDTPPPTVSGTLHIGHVFSYTQTDIIARYKRMSGFAIFYPFGFDNNGLATERFVEKKRGIRGHMISRSEFIQTCLDEAAEAEKSFADLWQQLGISADWNNTYSTISAPVRKITQESFIQLYKKGFVYRTCEPALYCVVCRTSVAQAELEDKESTTYFNTIVFKDSNGNDLLIGTTRPELLPSCVAVLYHPDDQRYTHLKGSVAQVPVYNFTVPLLADEQVAIDKGTGLVMVCTFGDKTDIEWYKKYNFAYRQSIGANGLFTENTGILAGLSVSKAREAILLELKNSGLLREQKQTTHSVGVHERCKNEIEYLLLKQWFVSVVKHKERLLELAETINWHPTFMKSRYRDWVENLKWDWCISRQRFYGIPFPVWHCNSCNTVIFADEKQLPLDPQETAYHGSCPQCGGNDIVPDTDVMDTWNTSSLTPYICYALRNPHDTKLFQDSDSKIEQFLPMGMRPQAHDIIRTWAFYTIAKSWMHHGTIPWRDIVISGHVLSDKNKKLSKSQSDNKAITPENLLANFPADAIRYWTASARLGQDVAFSEDQIKIGARLTTKLWNAFRFIQPHVSGYDSSKEPKDFGVVNEWMLHRATEVFNQYKAAFESFEYGLALEAVERFFWHDYCDNYIEIIKNQLFNPELYEAEQVQATQWTVQHVGLRILQLYAPFVPFITHELYELFYNGFMGHESIHTTQFADVQKTYQYPESVASMDLIIRLIGQVRKLKSVHQISLKTPITVLYIAASKQEAAMLHHHEQLIKGVTQAEKLEYVALEDAKHDLSKIDESIYAWVTTIEQQ